MNKLIAHRGLKKDFHENTLESFKAALENPNYVGFECDIRTTKDKIFIINHNATIGSDIISLSTYEELKQKYNIVSLEEVLNLSTTKIKLLEIKESNIDISKFLQLLSKYNAENIYVMSFFNKVIQKIAKEQPKIKIGVLNYVLNSEEDYQYYNFICLLEGILSPSLIKYFKEKKIMVFIYGIHNLEKTIATYPDNYYITDENY